MSKAMSESAPLPSGNAPSPPRSGGEGGGEGALLQAALAEQPFAFRAGTGRATALSNALVLGGALLAAVAAVQRYTHVLSAPGAQFSLARERCHGVVRAGRNDCGTSTHACAGQARQDAQAEEWISLPAGTCERIAGGRLRGGGGA